MPRATTTCFAASSSAHARPLSGDAACRSTSASSSSVTTHPGTRPAWKARATPGREDVRVRDDRPPDPLPAHPAQELVLLAGVVADLGDDEVRPGPRLEPELEELRDEVALEPLERVHGAAEEEVVARWIGRAVRLGPLHGARAELAQEREERDGVDVEHRLREALEAVDRVVAADREDGGEAARQQVPAQALEPVPVPVARRDVDDDVVAQRPERLAGRVRAQARVPAGVVGDRERGDPRVAREVRGHPERPLAAGVGELAGPRHELHDGRERTGRREGSAERAGAGRGQRGAAATLVFGWVDLGIGRRVLRRRSARTGSRR